MSSPESPKSSLLLVEDDPSTARALRAILERKGFVVVVAATLAAGLAALDARPDWMILDLMLPDGDGGDLLHRVRERGLPVRVVVTTGSHDHDRLRRVDGLRPDALLGKPIRLQDLLGHLGLNS